MYTYFKTHIAAYDAYAHTPQRFSSKCGENSHIWSKAKPGAHVNKEKGTQNITRRKHEGIHIIGTTGNTNKGGGT